MEVSKSDPLHGPLAWHGMRRRRQRKRSALAYSDTRFVRNLQCVQPARHDLLILNLTIRGKEVLKRRPDHNAVARECGGEEYALPSHPRYLHNRTKSMSRRPGDKPVNMTGIEGDVQSRRLLANEVPMFDAAHAVVDRVTDRFVGVSVRGG